MIQYLPAGQVTILPWHRGFVSAISGLLALHLFASSWLALAAAPYLWTWSIFCLFILNAWLSWVFLRQGCALIQNGSVRYWHWFNFIPSDEPLLLNKLIIKRFANSRYLPEFERLAEYQFAVSSGTISRAGVPKPIRFEFGSLVPWLAADLKMAQQVFGTQELMKHHDLAPFSHSELLSMLTYSAASDPYRTSWLYRLTTPTGTTLGHLEVRIGRNRVTGAELSFGLIKEFRRCGYMTAAIKAVVQAFQAEYGVQYFAARTKGTNTACQKLLEHLAFRPMTVQESHRFFGEYEQNKKDFILESRVFESRAGAPRSI